METILKRKLRHVKPSKSDAGMVSRFIRLGETHGLKLYRIEEVRDMCFQRQEVASWHNLAPKCWEPFTVRWCSVYWYGFHTECVDKTLSHTYGDEYDEGCGTTSELDGALVRLFKPEDKATDLHCGNMGWLSRLNKWVAIDFSHINDKYGDVMEHIPYDCSCSSSQLSEFGCECDPDYRREDYQDIFDGEETDE